jgi:hypothetical protein
MASKGKKAPARGRRKHSVPSAVRGGEGLPLTQEEAEFREGAAERAAETAVDTAAPDAIVEGQPQGEPGSPGPAQDYLEPDYDTPDDDEQEATTEGPKFTAADEARYRELDRRIDREERGWFEGVREIRDKQYWRLEKDQDGKPKYRSFRQWLEEHKGRDKTWATKGTNWLAVIEAQERLGIACPIGIKAAQALNPVKGREKCQAVGGLTAVLREAYHEERLDKDGRISYDGLKAVVSMRCGFYLPTGDKPAAASYEQYRQDYRKAQEWGKSLSVKTSYSVMAETLLRGLPSDHLLNVCKEKRQLPRPEDLLSQYTGEALDAVLVDLGVLAKELGDDSALLARIAKNKELLKEQSKPLAPVKEELRKDKAEALKRGLIVKRPKNEENQDADQTEPGLNARAGEGEAEGGGEQCEVKDHLDDALKALKEALDSEEWPEPEEVNLLARIKEAATSCREASDKVLNKVQEKLLEGEVEPEPIPSK